MNVLILGSGGREHAFAWKMRQSKACKNVYVAPGNGGTAEIATNVALNIHDFLSVKQWVLANKIDLVLVGPEQVLVDGIYDFFKADSELQAIHFIGPSQKGAQLEGSKSFAKYFMQRHNIPTAAFNEFTNENLEEAYQFIENNKAPFVLKADGLAAGKGVVITESIDEAKQTMKEMIAEAKFGKSSSKVIIEEFLKGIEFSVFILSDGKNYVELPNAKDYKRIGEGDVGLNTGGMGAISPVPFVTAALMEKVTERIIKPTVEGLAKENIIYKGFIYIGLILVNNEPYVIEYNCRMGDPETEIVMPRLESDLLELCLACSEEKLGEFEIEHSQQHGAAVILAAGGYPEAYEKGHEIKIPESAETFTFHAGTQIKDGKLLSNGGRVLAVSALGNTLQEALEKAKKQAAAISFQDKYYRKDIGYEF